MLEDILQESQGQHSDVCVDWVEVITSLVSPNWTHDNRSKLLHMGLSSSGGHL